MRSFATLLIFCLLLLYCALPLLANAFLYDVPNQADLQVSAPTMSELNAVGRWYERILPQRFHARQTVSINVLTSQDMRIYIESSAPAESADHEEGDIDGVFQNSPPCISLRAPGSSKPDLLTLAHEYGHYLWFDELSKADRAQFQQIYDHQKAAHRLITPYASTDVQEGFAEAFSYYINEPQYLLRVDPLSYYFLSRWHYHH